jgi:hypothetical protein
MNSPVGWVLPAVAVASAAVAIAAGPDLSLAVPASVIAVVAAGAVFLGAWHGAPDRRTAPASDGWPPESERVRMVFRSGSFGREYLVDLLDRVERTGVRPDLPLRTANETRRITELPAEQFDEYVRSRLSYLEART